MLNFLKLPIFGRKKLNIAFEYGVHFALVAQEQKVELTAEIMQRMEDIIQSEFVTKTPLILAQEMGPNLLAGFQPEEPEKVDVTNIYE